MQWQEKKTSVRSVALIYILNARRPFITAQITPPAAAGLDFCS